MTNLQKQEVVASVKILKEVHEEIKRTLKTEKLIPLKVYWQSVRK